jgi:uncharacterized Zn-finger protein
VTKTLSSVSEREKKTSNKKIMITANWRVKCNVTCPYCDEQIDIYNQVKESFEWLPSPGETAILETEIECPKCHRDFIIQKVEHC